MTLVHTITEVPDSVFFPALDEIQQINWDNIVDPTRNSAVFNTSKSIHIRRHKIPNGPLPRSLEEWCNITECENDPHATNTYINVCLAADWIYKQVAGKALGRIMIVRLESKGSVGLHIDPHEYFKMYSRFHIPFKTNDMVLFSGNDISITEHMPVKTLNRLNNRSPHQLINNGNDYRIHLIVDVAINGGNQIF